MLRVLAFNFLFYFFLTRVEFLVRNKQKYYTHLDAAKSMSVRPRTKQQRSLDRSNLSGVLNSTMTHWFHAPREEQKLHTRKKMVGRNAQNYFTQIILATRCFYITRCRGTTWYWPQFKYLFHFVCTCTQKKKKEKKTERKKVKVKSSDKRFGPMWRIMSPLTLTKLHFPGLRKHKSWPSICGFALLSFHVRLHKKSKLYVTNWPNTYDPFLLGSGAVERD